MAAREDLMRFGVAIGVVVLAGVVAGCASNDWKEWRSHSTHFASGDHMAFSLKNQGSTPRVSASDSRLAASQAWWGEPVVVRPDQIFQN
jgi:type IV pilus biogenesis protein CpaD/CtpE